MNVPYVYDTGLLIAIDNNDRLAWLRHNLALDEQRMIIVPSVVVGQAWRDPRRQVRLGKFLNSCRVEPVGIEVAKAAGILCGRTRTSDLIDAIVVVLAAIHDAIVWTSDPDDIQNLIHAQGNKPSLVIRKV